MLVVDKNAEAEVIINKSGITIRLKVTDMRVMGRATQGVRLINLEKRNDEIASVCVVPADDEAEENDNAEAQEIYLWTPIIIYIIKNVLKIK